MRLSRTYTGSVRNFQRRSPTYLLKRLVREVYANPHTEKEIQNVLMVKSYYFDRKPKYPHLKPRKKLKVTKLDFIDDNSASRKRNQNFVMERRNYHFYRKPKQPY